MRFRRRADCVERINGTFNPELYRWIPETDKAGFFVAEYVSRGVNVAGYEDERSMLRGREESKKRVDETRHGVDRLFLLNILYRMAIMADYQPAWLPVDLLSQHC